jgi:hypothetical protein
MIGQASMKGVERGARMSCLPAYLPTYVFACSLHIISSQLNAHPTAPPGLGLRPLNHASRIKQAIKSRQFQLVILVTCHFHHLRQLSHLKPIISKGKIEPSSLDRSIDSPAKSSLKSAFKIESTIHIASPIFDLHSPDRPARRAG